MNLVYAFDPNRFHLGVLCKRKHEWPGTRQSLRRTYFDKHGKNCSQCVGCSGARTKDWLLSFVDSKSLGLADNQRLGPVCKNNHLWQGHRLTLRVKGKCPDCERIRKQSLTPEQYQAKMAKARAWYARRPYDPVAQKAKHEAIKKRMAVDADFAQHIRDQRRRHKEQARRRQGKRKLESLEIRQMRKAIMRAGKLPSVARLVANEQRRYWQKNPTARRQAEAEWNRNKWRFNYLTKPDLRLYTRERSRRRKLQQKKQTVWKISVLQLRAKFNKFNNACAYCGSSVEIQIEHIKPIKKGGLHHISNIVPACRSCNYSKAAHPVEKWYRAQPFFDDSRLKLIKSLMVPVEAEQLSFALPA
jgi:hypothetical protein